MPKNVKIVLPDEGDWLSFHGIPVQIIVNGHDTDHSCCVVVGTTAPGGKVPPHAHRFDEGFYLLDGGMTFQAGANRIAIEEGGFIQIGADVAHFPENKSERPTRQLVICAPAGFDSFQRAVGVKANGPTGPFAKEKKDDVIQMMKVAPDFGIDLDPPAISLNEKEPDVTIRQPLEGQTVSAAGDLYRFLVTGQQTNDRYALWHATVPPGGGPPPHIHTKEIEIFYILKGSLSLFDDGERVVATAGTTAILPKGSRHWFKNESNDEVELLIAIAPAGLEQMFFKTGKLWSGQTSASLGKMSQQEKEKLLEVAPEYGLEIDIQ